MLKRTIKYTDFNGVDQTEDHYFNVSPREFAEWEMNEATLLEDGNVAGGFLAHLENVGKSKDGKLIMSTFKDIISRSYGVRSDDGRRFVKSAQLSEEFLQSGAYDQLFIELVTNADKAAEFVRGIVPVTTVSDQPQVTTITAIDTLSADQLRDELLRRQAETDGPYGEIGG